MEWKEVYAIASQLQSISSKELTDKLSFYLGHPTYNPHWEAIPDTKGKLSATDFMEAYDLKTNQSAKVSGYRDTGKPFLQDRKTRVINRCLIRNHFCNGV